MTRPEFFRLIGLAHGLFFLFALPGFGQDNPCVNKSWLATPIVAHSEGEEGGIGGTGFLPESDADSILFAAHDGAGEEGMGGTGIVGVITGFGSICVNAIEIHYDKTTLIQMDDQASQSKKLALGQSVSVRAILQAGAYYAREISVFHEVFGPVEAINLAENQFVILGQTINFPSALMSGIDVGRTLAVSGHRLPDGSMTALRVDTHLPRAVVSLLGPVTQVMENKIRIGAQIIDVSNQVNVPKMGDEVMVRGRLQDGVLNADHIRYQPRLSFRVPVERIYMQGYVRPVSDGRLNLEGASIKMEAGDQVQALIPGERIELEMRVGPGGEMVANHGVNERSSLNSAPASRPVGQPAGRFGFQRPEKLRPEIPRPEIPRPGLMRPQRSNPPRVDLQRQGK